MTFKGSRLYQDWHRRVVEPPLNDFVICITASSRTAVSGTGKTTLETAIAKETDRTDEGFDAETKASLDAAELAYDVYPEIEQRSAIVWDEAQGAPGTTGLDARRAMKQESIDAISAILANRDTNLTIIIGAQIFAMLDPRIYPMIDAWLLIRAGPDDPNGPLGTYHKVHVEDYNLGNPQVKTPAIEDFGWERIPHDDPDYQELEHLKQLAKTRNYERDGEDADAEANGSKELTQEQRNQLIKKQYKELDVTQQELADIFDVSQRRVSQIVNG